MTPLRPAAAIAAALVIGAAACSRAPRPVPLPTAWPRIEVYPPSLGRHAGPLALNDSAVVTADPAHPGWYTAAYPRYGAQTRLYITVSEPGAAGAQAALDNRLERMALNTGGAPTQMTELRSPGGWECRLAVTHAGSPTPVQFVALERRRGAMVSGSLRIDKAATAPPDSLAPVIDAVARDLILALRSLQ